MLSASSTPCPSSSSSKCFLQHQGFLEPSQLSVKKRHNFLKICSHGSNPFRRCTKGFSSSSFTVQHLSSKSHKRNPIHVKSEYEYPSKPEDPNHLSKQLRAFYLFTRPYAIMGTVIGITSVSLLPLETISDLSPVFFVGMLQALVPAVLMNIYTVGINQIYDVEIDKINKPELPLASGDMSMKTGKLIVFISLLMFPLLRWKKYPFLAASYILINRGIVSQLAFFVHIQKHVLGRPLVYTKSVLFGVAFMCILSTVIALYKDIPDVEGDQEYGIQSLAAKLGKKKVFCHCVIALVLRVRAQSIDLNSKATVSSFYLFIWKLMYAEYFLLPLVR